MPPETVKFLLVDDLDQNLLALEALLRRDGLELHKARSGPEALELLLVHDFALALLDVQMSGMDGFELAELMRGTERTRRIPIIFLTAVATDERRRFRGYETGAVDYLLKPVDGQVLKSKTDVFFALEEQRQALARQRDELRLRSEQLSGALARLEAHVDNSPLGVLQYDAAGRITAWSKGAERIFGWSADDATGRPVAELLFADAEAADAFRAHIREMMTGAPRSVRAYRHRKRDGVPVDCEWYSSALLDTAGAPISFSVQVLDITDRRRAEERQRLLIGELNHRVKNMLATVQAIATQTARHARDLGGFSADFAGRLQALARAHSLLSSTTWQGAAVSEVLRDQLQLGAIDEVRLACEGPDVNLPAQQALHLALILHELSTNATKYGAFSTPEGRASVRWALQDDRLVLHWVESGGPPVSPPTRRGFGTTLIEASVRPEGGTATVTYAAEGVSWEIAMPLPHVEKPANPQAARPAWAPPKSEIAAPSVAGRRFLIVEDEPLVAFELAAILEDAGAEVVATAGTAEQALALAETAGLDGALLDGNLRGRPVDDVASALARRKIPFLFVSGYGREHLPPGFEDAAVVGKPFTHPQLLRAATQLVAKGARPTIQ